MRKAQHLRPKASDIADAEVGCFAFSRLASHIRVLSQVGGKAHFASKTTILVLIRIFDPRLFSPRRFRVLVYQSSGPPRGSHTRLQSVPVHRGDGGALVESTPNCGLPTSLSHLRGLSDLPSRATALAAGALSSVYQTYNHKENSLVIKSRLGQYHPSRLVLTLKASVRDLSIHQRCVWKFPAPILLHERAFAYLDHRRSAIQPLSGWLSGSKV
jgi:hypothetical protein